MTKTLDCGKGFTELQFTKGEQERKQNLKFIIQQEYITNDITLKYYFQAPFNKLTSYSNQNIKNKLFHKSLTL